MARTNRPPEEEQDLNLAPIMNMVIILIPLLLLSVVFVEIAVINITAPKLNVGAPSSEPPPEEEKPLNLTVAIGAKGFRIGAEGGNLPPVPGCPSDGPTICLNQSKNVDVTEKFTKARRTMSTGDLTGGEVFLKEGLAVYDWRSLYNSLMKIKKQFPKETIVNVSADPDIPFAAIVRLMDVTRYQLDKDDYGSDSDFWSAEVKKANNKYESLFSDPVLSVVQ